MSKQPTYPPPGAKKTATTAPTATQETGVNRHRYKRGGRWPYNTGRWRALRRQAVIEAHGRCAECGRQDKRLDAHHVKPLTSSEIATQNEEAAYGAELRILCISCHSMITRGVPQTERARISEWKAFIDGP